MVRVIPQCLPHFANRHINGGVRVDVNVITPELVDDLRPGDQLSYARDEKKQQLQRQPFDAYWPPVPAQFKCRRIEFELSESGYRGGSRLVHRGTYAQILLRHSDANTLQR